MPDSTNIGEAITSLYTFNDDKNNIYVIEGMGEVANSSKDENSIIKLMADLISSSVGFNRTDKLITMSKDEENRTYLPHYPHGTIHSLIGSFEVLLIGGPDFDKAEIERKKKLN